MASAPSIVRAGDLEIDVGAHYVRRDGRSVPLRHQTMRVLQYLLEHRVRVVPKDELLNEMWADLAVTDDVLSQCIKEIRRAVGDDGRVQRFIRTVPRVGYQFIAPIEERATLYETITSEVEETRSVSVEIETELDDPQPETPPAVSLPASPASRRTRTTGWTIGALAVIVVVAAGAALGVERWRRPPAGSHVAGKRSIAVARFANRSGRADLDWLSEGVRDMLVTDLARSPDLAIVSSQQISSDVRRSGWNTLEPLPLDRAIDIAKTAGAQSVVVGSVLQAGGAVRVDVQVYDTAAGALAAAERISVDRLDDLFQAVDRVSLRLIERLGVAVGADVGRREVATMMTHDIEAYRAYSLGLELANSLHQEAAIEQFKRATAIDGSFAMANARIGYTYVMALGRAKEGKPFLADALRRGERLTDRDRNVIQAWYATADEDFGAAIEMYRKGIAADPGDDESYWRLGHLLAGEERFIEAIASFERGLSVNARSVDLLNDLCIVLSDVGRHAEAIAACARAAAVAPTEANVADSLGLAYQAAGDADRAIEAYTRAVRLDRTLEVAFTHRGNVFFQRGQYRRAAEDYQAYMERAGSVPMRIRAYESLARIAFRQGSVPQAREYVRQSEPFWAPGQGGLLLEPMGALLGDHTLRARYTRAIGPDTSSAALGRGGRLSRRLDCFFRGSRALMRHEPDEALRWFRQLQTHRSIMWHIEPLDDALANALFDLGRTDEAIDEYQRVIEHVPSLPRARFQLARAYDRKGDAASARRAYAGFLEEWKDADHDAPEFMAASTWLTAHP